MKLGLEGMTCNGDLRKDPFNNPAAERDDAHDDEADQLDLNADAACPR